MVPEENSNLFHIPITEYLCKQDYAELVYKDLYACPMDFPPLSAASDRCACGKKNEAG